jgi:hypothetical protein
VTPGPDAYHARQAAALDAPIGDVVGCRGAALEVSVGPARALTASPKLPALLPADQRAKALAYRSGLPERNLDAVGAVPLPIRGLTATPARRDVIRAA